MQHMNTVLKGMDLRLKQYDSLVEVKHRFDESEVYMIADVAKLMNVSANKLYTFCLEEGWPMLTVANPNGLSRVKRKLIAGRFLKALKKQVTIIKQHAKKIV